MSPLEISVLIWYYAHADDHPLYFKKPPAWDDLVSRFMGADLLRLTKAGEQWSSVYRLTQRGEVYVDSLRSVPLPRATWVTDWPTMEPPQARSAVDPVDGIVAPCSTRV